MTDTDRARTTGPALEKMHQFLLWLLPTVEKLPRSHKFTLGDRIEGTALDVLERLIEATYTRRAEPLLLQANLGRGGSLSNNPNNLRAANRNNNDVGNRNNNNGFRLASTPRCARAAAFTDAAGVFRGVQGLA